MDFAVVDGEFGEIYAVVAKDDGATTGLAVRSYASLVDYTINAKFDDIASLCAALIAGSDIIWPAVKNLFRARVFDEYFLMSFAAIAAFVSSGTMGLASETCAPIVHTG